MKPRSFSRGALAALLLAGGLCTAQAQSASPGMQPAPPADPAQTPSTALPPTSPAPDAGAGIGGIDQDEAQAIMAARARCGQAVGAQAQQDCMNQAQQDYYRARSGGAGAAGQPGSPAPDASGPPGSPGSPGATTPRQ